MDESRKEELRTIVDEAVDDAMRRKFKAVSSKLDILTGTIDKLFLQIDEDRTDIALIKSSMAATEQLMRDVLQMIHTQTRRLEKKVNEKTEDTIDAAGEAVANLVSPAMDEAMRKAARGVKPSRSWWKFW